MLLYYYQLLSTLVIIISIIYLNSKAEGFATLRANQGIVIDWIEPKKTLIFPCLCKHVISRLVQPSTFILCCTNCKTTILSLKQIPTPITHELSILPPQHKIHSLWTKGNESYWVRLRETSLWKKTKRIPTIAFLNAYTF